jgi:8-oxo-dGTP pyrophosphatase MutT (NUDIX family)
MAAGGTPAPIHPAATVLLLREADDGLQVLLTQRAAGLAFMGGLWVFPGGRLEDADASADIAARLSPGCAGRLALERMLDLHDARPIDPAIALALHVAACRETFEEAGLLLAHPAAAATATPCDAAQVARIQARRADTVDAGAFLRLLIDEDLLLDVDQLVYWSHWITPALEKRRFDTRFFAIGVPPGQEASADLGELTQHAWLTEGEVTARLAAGSMKLAPPTIATLHDLWRSHARHGGLHSMLEAERGRAVPPILPKLVFDSDEFEAVLPWDPDYASLPGEGCAVTAEVPPCLRELPSRRRFRRP